MITKLVLGVWPLKKKKPNILLEILKVGVEVVFDILFCNKY